MKPLLATIVIVSLLCGCVSFSDSTYKSIEASRIVVVNATRAFGDYCNAMQSVKPVPKETIDRARTAFNEWKSASLIVANALQAYMAIEAQVKLGVATKEQLAAVRVNVDSAQGAMLTSQSAVITSTQRTQ